MKQISQTLTRLSVTSGIGLWSLAMPAIAHAQTPILNCKEIQGTGGGGSGGLGGIACPTDAGNVSQIIGRAIGLVLIIAVLLAFVFLIYGGIRWILSGGDKDATAKARGTITAAVIGLALVFLSFVIIQVVGGLLGVNPFQLDISALKLQP